MSTLRTVTLELLRPGPTHNQLLSPLTDYLAICQDYGAVTVNLPFEHHEMLRQREALSYAVPPSLREAQLQQTAGDIAGVLAGIPPLVAALPEVRYGEDTLIHLRLVLSAAELALLPFELANAPQGFPGEDKPMLLQSIAPMTLTREVRMATVAGACWVRPLRVLVAVASPPGIEPVPAREHLLALRRALAPWVRAERRGGLGELITVLPRASVAAIRAACAQDSYTHVHILAHGAMDPTSDEQRYGLALFDTSGNKMDVVVGSRLAAALRTKRQGDGGFSSPNVVTIASCDSGKLQSVIFPGASLAHDLHEAGIPWVIGAQFPLSMRGSVLMTQILYGAFARGDDPRVALHQMRQTLRSECPEAHDWASVVAYAAVPADFDDQVRGARQLQAQRALNVAFEQIDDFFTARPADAEGAPPLLSPTEQQHLAGILHRLDEHVGALKQLSPRTDGPLERKQKADIFGLMGSAEKRRAHKLYRGEMGATKTGTPAPPAAKDGEPVDTWQAALRRARDYYLEAGRLVMHNHWVLTQYLCICHILDQEVPAEWWTVAYVSAQIDLDLGDPVMQAWAHASLAELHLLALAVPGKEVSARDARQQAVESATRLLRLAGRGSFPVGSTRRQFERYAGWWKQGTHRQIVAGAEAVIKALSDE